MMSLRVLAALGLAAALGAGCRSPIEWQRVPEAPEQASAGSPAPDDVVRGDGRAAPAEAEPAGGGANPASVGMAPTPGGAIETGAAEAGQAGTAEAEQAGAAEVAAPGSPLSGPGADGSSPRPADMLTDEEQARAAALALGDTAVQGIVAAAVDRDAPPLPASGETDTDVVASLAERPSFRVLYAERSPDKEAAGRQAEVAVYRYDTGEAVLAAVDLATGQVTPLELPAGAQMPVVPAEVAEAATVARRDPGVQAALASAGLEPETAAANGLLTGTADPESPCAGHRCLRLFFSSFREPVPTFSVVVDLVTLRVVSVVPMAQEGGSP